MNQMGSGAHILKDEEGLASRQTLFCSYPHFVQASGTLKAECPVPRNAATPIDLQP
jgi:hypothetical protein